MEKLLFIYNARSGKRNTYLDALHKIFSPGNYPCRLCEITYGNFGERKEWKQFRNSSAIKMEFFHKDEFEKSYASKFGYKFEYPIILSEDQNGLEVFISAEELEEIKRPKDLIRLIEVRRASGRG
ncbi:GTPase [Salegentibacter chungangensis]|uniref:GTPase n=1 Tax=Salegentibacter chungangensis TaxID=1335724 RepID=A0ABW3NUW8_9FLAO